MYVILHSVLTINYRLESAAPLNDDRDRRRVLVINECQETKSSKTGNLNRKRSTGSDAVLPLQNEDSPSTQEMLRVCKMHSLRTTLHGIEEIRLCTCSALFKFVEE